MADRPVAADVAKLAGTSTAVVSYVVNDGPRPVAEATRRRVLEAIDALGYRPNRAARALRAQRSAVLGLVVPEITNPFFGALADAVQRVALDRDLLTLVAAAGFDDARVDELADVFVSSSVDGLVVVGGRRPSIADVATVHVHDGPVGARIVGADERLAGALAVDHLAAEDYDAIGLLAAGSRRGVVAAREQGWRAEMERRGLDGPVITSAYDRADAARVVEALLPSRTRLGLVCVTDEQAFGVLAAAHRLGVDVPGELGIVTIDGTAETETCWPPLTSVVIPIESMAAAAVSVLLDGAPAPEPLAPDLVVRLSTGDGGQRVGGASEGPDA